LRSVDGNRELLREIAGLFVDGCPGALKRMREAVVARDAQALEQAAHSFKGSLGFFYAQRASEAATALERIGREGDLQRADDAFAALERELAQLAPALSALTQEAVR
jgi:HPt (histidine-containing phosphotransfer) domain-containing protein